MKKIKITHINFCLICVIWGGLGGFIVGHFITQQAILAFPLLILNSCLIGFGGRFIFEVE